MHTMVMIREHEGMEEWHCPTCGRHMLVNWKPKFKRTILQDGDPNVSHNGFKNNLHAEPGQALSAQDTTVEKPVDESRLNPWKAWLDETDFDSLWNRDNQ